MKHCSSIDEPLKWRILLRLSWCQLNLEFYFVAWVWNNKDPSWTEIQFNTGLLLQHRAQNVDNSHSKNLYLQSRLSTRDQYQNEIQNLIMKLKHFRDLLISYVKVLNGHLPFTYWLVINHFFNLFSLRSLGKGWCTNLTSSLTNMNLVWLEPRVTQAR